MSLVQPPERHGLLVLSQAPALSLTTVWPTAMVLTQGDAASRGALRASQGCQTLLGWPGAKSSNRNPLTHWGFSVVEK